MALELHALERKLIHIWSLDFPRRRIAVVSHLGMTKIIDEDKEDVRFRRGRDAERRGESERCKKVH